WPPSDACTGYLQWLSSAPAWARWRWCIASIGGQGEPGLVLVAAVEHPHIADLLHQRGAAAPGQFRHDQVALFPVTHARAHLEQLVRQQGEFEFTLHAGGEAAIADVDDGFASMRQTAQMLLLSFSELLSHG